MCIAIGYFIHNLGIIAIFKFIDPGAAEIIVENTMVVMKEWMKSFGATSEMISATMQEMQKNNPNIMIGAFPYYTDDGFGANIVCRAKNLNELKNIASIIGRFYSTTDI